MLSLLKITRVVYRGYAGDGEHHVFRLMCVALVSILIALNPGSLSNDTLSMIAVIVSVLAGFSFNAMFSSSSYSISDLPKSQSESDRYDLQKLTILLDNFHKRSRYFLIISVTCLLIVFLLGVHIEPNFGIIDEFFNISSFFHKIWSWSCFLVRFTVLLAFFEILYSFYRLAETIFSILDTRRKYLQVSR